MNSIIESKIKDYLRFGNKQNINASKLAAQKREIEEELRKMEKSDISENFDYNEEVDKLKSVCFKVAKYKYWEKYYNKFKEQFLDKPVSERETSDIIDVGSIVEYTVKNRKIVVLIVPMHLSNRRINAVGVDTPTGSALLGHKKGDIVTVESRKLKLEIKEVF